jgi:WXXGXW repeat (2 copies)
MTRKFFFLSSFLLLFFALAIPTSTPAQVAVGISVRIGPPPLRVYAQPLCPGPDYIWTPGYWAYADAGYYWVPGAWVMAPRPGFLWTPGYWGFVGGVYAWHAGYWGPHVGFYGGINYGFGYGGVGFGGGEWRGGHFFYNTAVAHVNVNIIHNTYVNRTVIVHNDSHVAFNGPGGVRAVPTREEMAAGREEHIDATREQMDHRDTAQHNPGNAFHGNVRGNDRGNARGNQRADNRQSHNNQARPQHNNNKPQHESKAKPQRKPDDHPRFR